MDEKGNQETRTNAKSEAKILTKKSNTPIIISAVFCGFLIILAVVFILVFGKKAEIEPPVEPGGITNVNSYNLGNFDEYDDIYGLDKTIIKNTSDLEDFYKQLIETKLYGGTSYYDRKDSDLSPLKELTYCDYLEINNREDESAECEKEASKENTLSYCDWFEIYGEDEDYKGGCNVETPTRVDYSSKRWQYCEGILNTDVNPGFSCDGYIEDYLDYYGFELPPEKFDDNYFKKHDLFVMDYDNYWCGGGFNRVRSIIKDDNTVTIEIGYNGSCGPCAPETSIILVEVKKDLIATSDSIETKEIQENDPYCVPGMSYKPMIYLYPEKETKITVKLGNPERLTTTYPQYDEETGWQIVARPDGTLKENGQDREYYGLYWEGISSFKQQDDGFVVAGKNTTDFLEEKLEILGLNEREANEFIVYWLPKMESNKYNYIRFATSEEINAEMPLEISPAPRTLIRVLMEFKPLDEKIEVKEQKLEKVERKGYTIVEWGGTELE